jgi:dTDP-4-dehydrorhamnose reductase
VKILILGGDGMLGHQLFKYFQSQHEVKVTLHQGLNTYKSFGLFSHDNAYQNIEVGSLGRLVDVLSDFQPEAVINAVGIVKQRPTAKESIPSLEINALLPHRLALLCKGMRARLVHMSTDCVFSGKKGNYVETDLSDAEDLYGKSKFLGEVHDRHCITLRTSIIGRELSRKKSLLEWLLSQHETVKGFKNAIFTGFSTLEMCRIIEKILMSHPNANGLYHVSSEAISKFDLLMLIKEKMHLDVQIIPDENFRCDRSLDSTRFRKEFHYAPPSWEKMIEEIANEN